MTDRRTLHTAHALCPHCLRQLKADIYADDGGKVWMTRTCPEHGETVTYVWPDAEHYEWLRSMRVAPTAPKCRDYLIDDECPRAAGCVSAICAVARWWKSRSRAAATRSVPCAS